MGFFSDIWEEIKDPFGTRRAGEAQASAFETSATQQRDLQRDLLAETKPLRDLALEQGQFQFGQQQRLLPEQTTSAIAANQAAQGAFPLLTGDINRQAGTGQPFQRRLAQGTSNIFSSLGAFGLEDSSVAGRAIGEFQSGLLGQDIENLQNQRFRLASLGVTPSTPSFFGGGTAGLGTGAQLGQSAIQSQLGAGQSVAAGLFGAGQQQADLVGIGLGFGLNKFL